MGLDDFLKDFVLKVFGHAHPLRFSSLEDSAIDQGLPLNPNSMKPQKTTTKAQKSATNRSRDISRRFPPVRKSSNK
jgi:hypothetical protein